MLIIWIAADGTETDLSEDGDWTGSYGDDYDGADDER